MTTRFTDSSEFYGRRLPVRTINGWIDDEVVDSERRNFEEAVLEVQAGVSNDMS